LQTISTEFLFNSVPFSNSLTRIRQALRAAFFASFLAAQERRNAQRKDKNSPNLHLALLHIRSILQTLK